MPDDSTQCWLFPGLFLRQVVATFDQERGSSDGGAILLKAADERLGLTRALVNCLSDVRDPDRVTHDLRELLQQRVFGIACGYPDGNDSDRLAEDPVHKMLLDRDPVEGEGLASQPTISRFENSASAKNLFRMGEELARGVVKRHRKRLRGRARRITIDLDSTADLARRPSSGDDSPASTRSSTVLVKRSPSSTSWPNCSTSSCAASTSANATTTSPMTR